MGGSGAGCEEYEIMIENNVVSFCMKFNTIQREREREGRRKRVFLAQHPVLFDTPRDNTDDVILLGPHFRPIGRLPP